MVDVPATTSQQREQLLSTEGMDAEMIRKVLEYTPTGLDPKNIEELEIQLLGMRYLDVSRSQVGQDSLPNIDKMFPNLQTFKVGCLLQKMNSLFFP